MLGDFDGWTGQRLQPIGMSGIWSGHVPGAMPGQSYRYAVTTNYFERMEKADPVGAATIEPPSTASVIAALDHDWADDEWMAQRGSRLGADAPISIYEVHLGSWGRHTTPGRRFVRYDEVADPLADHVLAHGFTHVELLPIMEHPFYGSWGYQTTGYFAPTARYGTPQDLMLMVDRLHQRGVGVIFDWVPSHFPNDPHGLARFDGTHLYEHADPRQGYHPDWTSAIFNYGRREVRSFLISSALAWLDRYHVDGLRVDAVASMLYLDYSRADGEWIPNRFGGRENLDAIDFLRQLNDAVHEEFPDAATFAEESTAWPMVTGSTAHGGLGFSYKWDMGWMHDTLQYIRREPVHRRFHHDELTFRAVYAFTERFVMPLSHDEVVHGKGSLLGKMPGDEWQRFANLRMLFGLSGRSRGRSCCSWVASCDAGGVGHDGTLDWRLHDAPLHDGVRAGSPPSTTSIAANRPPRAATPTQPGSVGSSAMTTPTASSPGCAPPPGRCCADPGRGQRHPAVHYSYRVGVPAGRPWVELLNSDAEVYGGSGKGNLGGVAAEDQPWHGSPYSLPLTLPPLAVVLLRPEEPPAEN